MAEESNVNPLLAAKPPATDYLTYLTLIEYNLSEENLPVLHQVLQDTELTVNIGWDLVHLLLPFLPGSQECLEDIASRGNPREVILKVTEALRLLEPDEQDQHSDDDEDDSTEAEPSSSTAQTFTAPIQLGESSLSPALPAQPVQSLFVLKFDVLLSLLSTLHLRIKTKYPSRFLATSLQAVLAAYNSADRYQQELTLSAVKFVKNLSGLKRPHLPPRTASGNLLRTGTGLSQPDPEAQSEPPTADENTLVTRLLQSFITHLLEDYILSLSSEDDVPGLAWSARLMEKFAPERIVPNKQTYAERFANDENLRTRTETVGQLVAIAQDLGLSTQELINTINDPEAEKHGKPGAEDEPPESAADIPLSKTGALFLYAARIIKQELYATTSVPTDAALRIFPDHATILTNFVGSLGVQTVGLEPEALLDAIMAIGLAAVEKNEIGEPTDDEHFSNYLRTTSLISANTPSPSLRYHAHYLTSTILRSHPHDLVRLTFIRDTFEHCPYENLKASAVGWLKGETLEANAPHQHGNQPEEESSDNIFASPVALTTVSPYLFPDLRQTFTSTADISENWMQFRTELGFYLSALNFFWLLLTAKFLHENLDIKGLHKSINLEETYLTPLKLAAARFREALQDGGELAVAEGEEGVGASKADLARLEEGIAMVERGIAGLNA